MGRGAMRNGREGWAGEGLWEMFSIDLAQPRRYIHGAVGPNILPGLQHLDHRWGALKLSEEDNQWTGGEESMRGISSGKSYST